MALRIVVDAIGIGMGVHIDLMHQCLLVHHVGHRSGKGVLGEEEDGRGSGRTWMIIMFIVVIVLAIIKA